MKIWTILLLVWLCGLSESQAQIILDNQTADKSYLVKINLIDTSSCQLTGAGPVVPLPPKSKIELPPPPPGSWVVGYGIERAPQQPHPAVIVGKGRCRLPGRHPDPGDEKVELVYTGNTLLIQPAKKNRPTKE